MNNVELAILDLFEKYYKRRYNGGLKVKKTPAGYKLELFLGNPDYPTMTLTSDCDNVEDFLKYVEQEVISRQLARVHWYKFDKIYPDDKIGNDCQNGPCNC